MYSSTFGAEETFGSDGSRDVEADEVEAPNDTLANKTMNEHMATYQGRRSRQRVLQKVPVLRRV